MHLFIQRLESGIKIFDWRKRIFSSDDGIIKKIMLPPLIITAKMDAVSFEFFDALRRRHFPPKRNFLAAHITLFHHLPGEEMASVENDLTSVCADRANVKLDFPHIRFLGRGTAVEISAPELVSLRTTLANRWQKLLTAQDRQKFKPHITVQNKTEPEAAKFLYENLKAEWQPRTGEAVGLQLWKYLGGPWQLAGEFSFKAHEK